MIVMGTVLLFLGVTLDVINFTLSFRRVFNYNTDRAAARSRPSSILLLPALVNAGGALCLVSLELNSRLAIIAALSVLHVVALTGIPWIFFRQRTHE